MYLRTEIDEKIYARRILFFFVALALTLVSLSVWARPAHAETEDATLPPVPATEHELQAPAQNFDLIQFLTNLLALAPANPEGSVTDAAGLAKALDPAYVQGSAEDKVSVEGNVVTVKQPLEVSTDITIAGEETDLTLALGENNVTLQGTNNISLFTGASLTVTGTGTLSNNDNVSVIELAGGNTLTVGAEAEEGPTIENQSESGNAISVIDPLANDFDEPCTINVISGSISGANAIGVGNTNFTTNLSITGGTLTSKGGSTVKGNAGTTVVANISGGEITTETSGSAAVNILGTADSSVTVSEGATITSKANEAYGIYMADGTLDIQGGKIVATCTEGAEAETPDDDGEYAVYVNGGEATITGGVIEGDTGAVMTAGGAVLNVGTAGDSGEATGTASITGGPYGIAAFGSAKVNVVAGSITADGAAIVTNGSDSQDVVITVDGGSITSALLGAYIPAGSLSFNAPATIVAPNGILQRGGDVDLNGGTITCDGTEPFAFGDATNDAGEPVEVPAGALIVDDASYPDVPESCILDGATLTGNIIATKNGEELSEPSGAITLNGGVFTNAGTYFVDQYAKKATTAYGLLTTGEAAKETLYVGSAASTISENLQTGDTITVYAQAQDTPLNVGAHTDVTILNNTESPLTVENAFGTVEIPAGESGLPKQDGDQPEPDSPVNNATITPSEVNVGGTVTITTTIVPTPGEPFTVAYPVDDLELAGDVQVTGLEGVTTGLNDNGEMVYSMETVPEDAVDPVVTVVAKYTVTGSEGKREIPVTFRIGTNAMPTAVTLQYSVGDVSDLDNTCTFNANGGALVDNDGIEVGSPYVYAFDNTTLTAVPVQAYRPGYLFLGWYVKTASGMQAVDPVGYEKAADAEFMAEWSPINVTMTPATQQVAYGKQAEVNAIVQIGDPTDSSIPLPEDLNLVPTDLSIELSPELNFITRTSSITNNGFTVVINFTAPMSDDVVTVTATYGGSEAAGAIVNVVETPEIGNPEAGTAAVYRLWNPWDGEHLLTQDQNEYNVLSTKYLWVPEGVTFYADVNKGVPVWRLYNPNNGDHFYTISENEYNELHDLGWNQEGRAFYSSLDTEYPVYRLWNSQQTADGGVGSHLWTPDYNEYRVLPALQEHGWIREGVSWFAAALPQGTEPGDPEEMLPGEGTTSEDDGSSNETNTETEVDTPKDDVGVAAARAE